MNSSSKQRCLVLFEESIKSKYTKKNYISHLNQFKKFIGIFSTDQLLMISQPQLQFLLENYLIELKQTMNPNSIPSKFRGIKHFFIMNNIDINWNIIQKIFPQKQKIQNLRSYTTKEIQKILYNTNKIRDKAIIHFLASTGARIGIFDHSLSIKHMKKMCDGSYAILLYAGYIDEYWSFLTPQASRILKKYHNNRQKNGEIFHNDTPIFATRQAIPKQLSWNGARSVIYRSVLKSNIRKSKLCDRYDIQINHGFRKRFNTILKLDNSVNYNIAEKLLGHKNGLDNVYLTPTIEELFIEFKKVVPKLEI